ncbi:MAG: glycosyltransferase family 87 protein [Acidobacteriaceae bacterium]
MTVLHDIQRMGTLMERKFRGDVRGSLPLPSILRRFTAAIFVLTIAAWGISFFCYRVLHLHYPYSYPMVPRQFRQLDFTMYSGCFPQLPHFPEICREHTAYPAPALMVYQFFYLFPHALVVFMATGVCMFATAAYLLGRAMVRRGVAARSAFIFAGTALICSYPILFVMDQGNIEVYLWLVIALGVWAYMRGGWTLAATLFGVAASMKFYPAVYLGLLLARKRYKAFFFGIMVAILATILSLWILGPTIHLAYLGVNQRLHNFSSTYVSTTQPGGIGFDHSLFSLVKATLPGQNYQMYASIYLPFAAVVGFVVYFWRIWRLPRINQVLALTIAAVVLPPFSIEYTLIHLYIPWALLALYAVDLARSSGTSQRIRGLGFCFACFAFLMTPESYFIVDGIRYSGQLKALVLVALFVAALRYPFPETEETIESWSE